jgi:hypothetical protein
MPGRTLSTNNSGAVVSHVLENGEHIPLSAKQIEDRGYNSQVREAFQISSASDIDPAWCFSKALIKKRILICGKDVIAPYPPSKLDAIKAEVSALQLSNNSSDMFASDEVFPSTRPTVHDLLDFYLKLVVRHVQYPDYFSSRPRQGLCIYIAAIHSWLSARQAERSFDEDVVVDAVKLIIKDFNSAESTGSPFPLPGFSDRQDVCSRVLSERTAACSAAFSAFFASHGGAVSVSVPSVNTSVAGGKQSVPTPAKQRRFIPFPSVARGGCINCGSAAHGIKDCPADPNTDCQICFNLGIFDGIRHMHKDCPNAGRVRH